MDDQGRRRVSVVLFDRFELLDVFGPLEMFGLSDERFEIVLLGPAAGSVASAQGPRSVAECSYFDAPGTDIVLVPGGQGTRTVVQDSEFLEWLRGFGARCKFVTSVCTGSAALAAAGLLDGYRATTNKVAFAWATSQSDRVAWIPEVRWVEDRDRWTSSGVSAGMDMTLALIARLEGEKLASRMADRAEYDWHRDPSWDPFAAKSGLVSD
jgi:transcriptional regulator GlxA family with amidase domain